MVFTPIQNWDQIAQQNIFPGESGGDYNAIFGYQNRQPGQPFYGVQPSQMTVGQAIEFTQPGGAYGQHVKGQIGRVATPIGAYQVVGTTLRAAVNALGLDPSMPFDKNTQDMIGQWIYQNQGPGAWEAWGGGGGVTASTKGGGDVDPLAYMMGGRDFPLFDPGPTKGDRWRGGLVAAGEALTSLGAGHGPTFEQTDAFLRGEMARRMATQNARGEYGARQAETAQQAAATNATAQWLAGQGPKGQALAEALLSGAMDGPTAVAALTDPKAVLPGVAGAAGVTPASAIDWLTKNKHTDLVEAVQAGILTPEDAMTEALQRDPVLPVDPNAPLSPETMGTINQLRDDIDRDTAAYAETNTAAQNIFAASTGTGGTSDFTMAQQFAKLLDPTSVVREGELSAVMSSSGTLPAFLTRLKGEVSQEGDKMSPQMKAEILRLTKQIVEVRRMSAEQKLDTYRRLAKAGGIDPTLLELNALPALPDAPGVTPLPEDY